MNSSATILTHGQIHELILHNVEKDTLLTYNSQVL